MHFIVYILTGRVYMFMPVNSNPEETVEIKVTSCTNGYFVEYQNGDGSKLYAVFEYGEGINAEVKACARMLQFIDSEIGPSTSRYSPARVHISLSPGDKFVDFEDDGKVE